MSQTIKDFITAFGLGTTSITTDAVGDNVIQFASSPQQIGLKGMLVEFTVAVAAAGMAQGIRFELRADTQADLASGSQVIVGDSGIILPAALTVGATFQVHVQPRVLASTFVFFGVFYNLVTDPASGSFAMFASLKQGGVSEVV